MFRISHFMHELAQAEATGAYPAPKRRGGEGGALRPHTGPVVIWNLIRRCNLTCKHCYAFSAARRGRCCRVPARPERRRWPPAG